MLTPTEALTQILAAIEPLGETEEVALPLATGRVLAEAPVSDISIPPFRKAMMDGFALRAAEFEGPRDDQGRIQLNCVGESRAGAPFEGMILPGHCIEIYTGAEVPDELDQVVMVEQSELRENRVFLSGDAKSSAHIQVPGEILTEGAAPLAAGRRLSAVDLSVLAAMGAHPLKVHRRVRTAVLTTGDELVPVWEKPERGQIREGNTLFLNSRLQDLEHDVVGVGIVPDEEQILLEEFGKLLDEVDCLITTGGVSMGKYDLVGRVFEQLGVEPHLHKVAVKPGKPIWFGMRGRVPVLGLPGNPVSSLLGLELFVRPVLAKLGGATGAELEERLCTGVWSGRETRPGDRQHNLPVRLSQGDDGRTLLEPLAWKGSADIVTVAEAQALAVVPAGTSAKPGDVLHYRPLG